MAGAAGGASCLIGRNSSLLSSPLPVMATENVMPTNIEEQPLNSLKSSFAVSEFAAEEGPATDGANTAAQPLAARLADPKPVVRKGAYAELAALWGAEACAAEEYETHAPMLRKLLADNASICHEPALDACLAFAKGAPAESVGAEARAAAGAIVEKHAAGKYGPKALDALLALFGSGKDAATATQAALASGAAHKVPKTRAAAAKGLVGVLRGFGGGAVDTKLVTTLVVGLVEHRDKLVRDEGLALLGELRLARGDVSAISP